MLIYINNLHDHIGLDKRKAQRKQNRINSALTRNRSNLHGTTRLGRSTMWNEVIIWNAAAIKKNKTMKWSNDYTFHFR